MKLLLALVKLFQAIVYMYDLNLYVYAAARIQVVEHAVTSNPKLKISLLNKG